MIWLRYETTNLTVGWNLKQISITYVKKLNINKKEKQNRRKKETPKSS